MADRVWWVSNKRMTVGVVTTDELVIKHAAPIVRKFTGQYLGDLLRWMERQGGLKYGEITTKGKSDANTDR